MGTATILAVDDEAHILQVLSLKLRNAGFHVLTASDAEEALELAATNSVDLLITDYHMPGMSGLELSAKLHQEPGRQRLPVILLTAHGMTIEPAILGGSGISACLTKPFSPREVLANVMNLTQAAQKAA